MARGRFVSKSLWNSKRFADCPDRAANLYQCMLHHTKVDGRLDADDMSLLVIAQRYGRSHGWTEETVAADRSYLERVGLIRTWGEGGNLYAEIVKFFDHNKIRADRESPSGIPDPPWRNGELEKLVLESATPGRGSTPSQEKSKSKSKSKPKGKGAGVDVLTHEDRINLVLECIPAAFREISAKNPDHPPMVAPSRPIAVVSEEVRGAADAIDHFGDRERLTAEIKRVVLCQGEKGLTVSTKGIIRGLGVIYHGTRYPEPGDASDG